MRTVKAALKLAFIFALPSGGAHAQCFETIELPPVIQCSDNGYNGSADFTMDCQTVHGGYGEIQVSCPTPPAGPGGIWGAVEPFGGGVGGSGGAGGGDANGGPSGF